VEGSSCPLGYIGAKHDIANVVLFLLSDAAAVPLLQTLLRWACAARRAISARMRRE